MLSCELWASASTKSSAERKMAQNSTKNPYGARNTFYGLIINLITITLWWWLWLHHHVINNFPFRNNTNNTQNHTHLHIGFLARAYTTKQWLWDVVSRWLPLFALHEFPHIIIALQDMARFRCFQFDCRFRWSPHIDMPISFYILLWTYKIYLPIDVFTCFTLFCVKWMWILKNERKREIEREIAGNRRNDVEHIYNLTRARCVRVYEFHSAKYVCHFHVQVRL